MSTRTSSGTGVNLVENWNRNKSGSDVSDLNCYRHDLHLWRCCAGSDTRRSENVLLFRLRTAVLCRLVFGGSCENDVTSMATRAENSKKMNGNFVRFPSPCPE